MCAPKAPTPPSATQTAGAQTGSNVATAIANQQLGAVNQTNPYGSLTYSQNGTYDFTDPSTGKVYKLPKMTASTTLSPEQQAIFNTGQQTQGNLANLAQEQSGRLGGLLNQDLDWSAQQEYLNNLTEGNLNPQWDRQQTALDTRLANSGIRMGSDAYTRAMDDFQQSRSSAYNTANLGNYKDALQSQLALRAQPLNEILALAGQGQVNVPQFQTGGQSQMANTDVAGLMNQAYQNQYSNYANQQNQYNSTLGGLFGLGSSALMAFSDRRLKRNIERVGTLPNGLPFYSFKYVGDDDQTYHGVMSDEVRAVMPDAVVVHPSGFDMVNYLKVLF